MGWHGVGLVVLASALVACSYPPLPSLAANTGADAGADAGALVGSGVSEACYGTGPVKVCLATAPTAELTFTQPVIDTSAGGTCSPTLSGADAYCVVAAADIMIDSRLRVIGAKPLVLLASNLIMTSSGLDVGSHWLNQKSDPEIGAAADSPECGTGMAPNPTGSGDGGAGGSYYGLGGSGGPGNDGVAAGVPAPVASAILTLRGGCPGQDGGGISGGVRGHGGGAIYLIAGQRIYLGGGILNGGEGGRGGGSGGSGGGGGGAGGMIGLDAPTITVLSILEANGGGGGEGSDPSTNGTKR